MIDPLIVHKNRIVPLSQACLSPGQVGLLAGWGVFTTLRLYRGLPFAFDRHWERMARDAARLHVPFVYQKEQVRLQIIEVTRANRREEGMARVYFVKNSSGVWSASEAQAPDTDLLVFTHELAPWPAAHRLRIQPLAIFSAGAFAGAKMLSWAPNSVLLEEARADGFDDVLLLNEKGQLAECTSANVFLVRDGKVLTPPLSSGCLPGVTREILFEIARGAGIEFVAQDLTTDHLSSAQEVFISSTTREVAGVSLIAPGWTYRTPGEITEALGAAFRRYVQSWLEGEGSLRPGRD